jgi:hypothetical protein
MARPALWMQPDIGVMIAGNRRHARRRSKMMQPFRCAYEFVWQAEIDEISGHRDVVGLLLDQIMGEQVEDLAPMHELPPAVPVHIAEHALRHELASPRPRHGAQMNVREMGEDEHGAARGSLRSLGH